MNASSKGLSRRMFLGGAALAGLASAGALAGCAAKDGGQEGLDGQTLAAGREADIVIVGSGLAGLCAGLKAREAGADVLVIEKGSALGTPSNSVLSGGALCAPNDRTEESIQAFIDEFDKKSKGKGDPDITRLIAENIQDGLDWLVSHGVQLIDPVPHTPYNLLKIYAAPGASQGMGPLMQTMVDAYEQAGGESLCDAKLLDLMFDARGNVAGIKVRGKEGVEIVRAKAVILATGGYVGNRQMLEEFVGPDADEIMVRGSKSITGDGILAAERAGAMLVQMGGEASLHIGAVSPKNVASGNPSNAIGYCLAINSEGRRYADESLGYVNHGKALMNQPGQVAALVFDDGIKQQEKVQQDIERFESFGSAPVAASSLDELADLIGVPADALKETVEEFNAAVADGRTIGLAVDKTNQAIKLEGPNYYAFYPLKPGCIMGFGGLYANADMQVLEADGTPLGRLYVAGEAVGGVFMYDYIAGSSLDRCIVTGITAAERALSDLG
ncbi:FAD-dependent oxidoreductase [Rubneribacter sp.]